MKTNTDPTTISADEYDPNLLLTTVQLNYTGSPEFQGENWETEWGNIGGFIQHTASTNTSYYPGDKYLKNGGTAYYFDQAYTTQVQPVVELYQLTLNKTAYQNLHQIARIMKAMVFERITDLYGDVPYSQAGLGYYERIYTPVYDEQEAIYEDLLKEVSEATDSLDDDADLPSGDIFYAVDPSTQIEKWKKFGYTLQLRMAMRLTKVDPATAQEYVEKVDGKTMESNDDNAIVQHEDGSDLTINRDSWEIHGQDSADLKLCSTYIDYLKDNDDPRLSVIAWIFATEDSDPASQQGLPPGYRYGGTVDSLNITKRADYPSLGMQGYSRLSEIILDPNAPNLILTYAESEFLLADAKKRWGIGDETAEQHYNNGVKAAITQLSAYGDDGVISDADAQTYLTNHPYKDADGLEQINTQFWASTIMNEYEAWCNWRRTGYPALTPTDYPGNATSGTIPRRLTYPSDQKVSNDDNYEEAVARLSGGDKMTSRMWWDVE
ncbi:SusD/RagB family nutrient-binding outer membrane lipoprotein [Parafilimonas sp.]|uniref:SusD/RagB family nutrient-binding outer membrane lipoprotein n=1 Tax=Parafilimonas sp. TaxID=1969739 RepID=UPI0039E4C276